MLVVLSLRQPKNWDNTTNTKDYNNPYDILFTQFSVTAHVNQSCVQIAPFASGYNFYDFTSDLYISMDNFPAGHFHPSNS
jgi:hypothetical protein